MIKFYKKNKKENILKWTNELKHMENKKESTLGFIYLFGYLFLVLCVTSVCISFATGFSIDCDYVVLVTGIFLVAGLNYYTRVLNKRKHFILECLILAIMLSPILCVNQFMMGYKSIFNCIITFANKYYKSSVESYEINSNQMMLYNTICILWISNIVSFILAEAVAKSGCFFPYLIVSMALVFSPLLVGETPIGIASIVYIITTISLIGGNQSVKEAQKFQQRSSIVNVKYFIYRIKLYWILCCICAVIVFFSGIFLSINQFSNNNKVLQLKENIQKKIVTLCKKDWIFVNGNSSFTEISQGNLKDAGNIEYKNIDVLSVEIPLKCNREFYLRGYIGADYQKNCWIGDSTTDKNIQMDGEDVNYFCDEEDLICRLIMSESMLLMKQSVDYKLDVCQVLNLINTDNLSYFPYLNQESYMLYDGLFISNIGNNGIEDNLCGSLNCYDRKNKKTVGSLELLTYLDVQKIYQQYLINREILEKVLGYSINKYEELEDNSVEKENTIINNNLYCEINKLPKNKFYVTKEEFQKKYKEEDWLGNTNVAYLSSDNCTTLSEIIYEVIELESYFDLEHYNEKIAYQYYLTVPEECKSTIQSAVMGATGNRKKITKNMDQKRNCWTDNYNNDNIEEIVSWVKRYLSDNATYSLTPGKVPENKDFISYFLSEKKSGYCMHFASSAVMMFRELGIPARYVEGYVIKKEDIENAKKNKNNQLNLFSNNMIDEEEEETTTLQVTLRDNRAHAWVEIYVNGFGWMPVEVTPGFYQENEINSVDSVLSATSTPITSNSSSSIISKNESSSGKKITISKTKTRNDSFLKWWEKQNVYKKSLLLGILILGSVVTSSLVIIYLRKIFVIAFRQKKFDKMNSRDKIINQYKSLEKLLSYYKIEKKRGKTEEEFCKLIVEKFQYMSEQEVVLYDSIVLNALYNNKKITDEQINSANLFLEKWDCKLKENSSKINLWYLKNIRLYYICK